MNESITPKGEGRVKTRTESKAAASNGAFSGERIDARHGAKDALEHVMKGVFIVCGLVAVAFVLVISAYLIISGIPAIKEVGLWNFLSGTDWHPNYKEEPSFGILPMILTSVYGTCGAIIIGVPLGFLMAVFLSKVANRKAAAVIREVVDLLAGIPSVVYGLVGMMVLLPFIRETFNLPAGDTLFAAIIVLAIMILPSIISVAETALNAVPREYEEASLALGATELETYFRVSAPAAKSGIAAAVVLGVGRAIGEAMAILMVAGNVANIPGLFKSVKFLTTAIAGEMSYAGGLHRQALFSIGLVLFVFIMLINAALNFFFKREKEGKS
jgi:phosphate transport system permease protein